MTSVFEDIARWRHLRNSSFFREKTVGFVPTMGNLHAGHLSLMEQACLHNDVSVMSIFLNAPQFEDQSDLADYPVTMKSDLDKARELGIDFVICPKHSALYPDDYSYRVTEKRLSKTLCGMKREDHFDGVLTVVLKLLQIVRPDRCYFGEKDYQQLQLVRGMASAFFLDLEIIACKTVRDPDGLALSSRNGRLSASERVLAAKFPEILRKGLSVDQVIYLLEKEGLTVEYVEEDMGRRFGAVQVGKTRLIDNFDLSDLEVSELD
jgi:pantoate--beta-alanine ligase